MFTPCTAEQILAWRGWKDYLGALEASPHRELARALSREKAPSVLASGAGIVRAIAQFHPSMLAQPPRIAVVGTTLSGPEFMDRGRWLLSGMPLVYQDDYPEVALFASHPHEEPHAQQIESELLRLVAGIPPVSVIPGDHVAALEAYRPDLIVLLYPACCETMERDMPEYRWLAPWVARGTPIVGCYYDASERSLGQGFFACAGIAAQRNADSPLGYAINTGMGALTTYGQALFGLFPPTDHHEHEWGQLRSASFAMGVFVRRSDASPVYGALLQGRGSPTPERVVTGFAPIGVGLQTGRLYHVSASPSGQVNLSLRHDDARIDPALIAELLPSPVDAIPDYRRALIAHLMVTGEEVGEEEDDDDPESQGNPFEFPMDLDRQEMLATVRQLFAQTPEELAAFDTLASLMSSPTGKMDELPLFVAADAEDIATIRSLIRAGADPDQRDRAGWTPLSHCAADSRLEAMRVLIEEGADIDAPLAINGATPLFIALQRGNDAAALRLLQAGADLDAEALPGSPRDILVAGAGGEQSQAWFASNA